jgi:hypothetical protein
LKPRYKPHECKSEPNCEICRDYVNKLDEYRQSISRGEPKRNIVFRVDRTSNLHKVDENKRKFDLPTPRLSRPKNMK